MAPFAVNLLSLIIVIGLSWAAVMWLSGRFHSERRDFQIDDREVDLDLPRASDPQDCSSCEGVGARHERGRIEPCESCGGTGVLVTPGSSDSGLA